VEILKRPEPIRVRKQAKMTIPEEREIDLMVYKLCELTYEEINKIDSEFEMSKEEYEKNE
jgi:hypothetical protein